MSQQDPSPDALLALQASQGCHEAFSTLYDRYCKETYRICYAICPQQTMAEDLNQEVWLNVYQKISQFDPSIGPFEHWLKRLARNRSIDHYRKLKREPETLTDMDVLLSYSRGDRSAKILDSKFDLRHAFTLLPALYRDVVELRFLDEEGYDTIAQRLNLPLGTVKSRIFRARHELRFLLTRQGHPSLSAVS